MKKNRTVESVPRVRKLSIRLARRKFFAVSYPKSGRTWLRFMVNDYLRRCFGIDVPQVFAVERKLRLRHRIVWTHMGGNFRRPYFGVMNFDTLMLKNVPYIFFKRNFYAILNSAYHHRVYRRRVMDVTPSEFIRHPHCGIVHIVSYYNMWLHLRGRLTTFKSFAYEDLKQDPAGTLRRVIEAFGLPPREEWIEAAVREGSVENMKKLAVSPDYAGTVLAPTDLNDERSAKVRSGRRASYTDLFSREDLEYIGRVIDMLYLGKDDPDFSACCRRID